MKSPVMALILHIHISIQHNLFCLITVFDCGASEKKTLMHLFPAGTQPRAAAFHPAQIRQEFLKGKKIKQIRERKGSEGEDGSDCKKK